MGKWQHVKAIFALPGTVLVFIPASLMILAHDIHLGWSVWVFFPIISILVGTTLMLAGLVLLAKTNILFSAIGKGTLSPWNPTKKLVVAGVYMHVRNPMYLGVYFILIGESVLFGSLSVSTWFLTFAIVNQVQIVKNEEPVLRKRFGNEYKEYMQNVPRWIPRLKPWTPPNRRYIDEQAELLRKRKRGGRPDGKMER